MINFYKNIDPSKITFNVDNSYPKISAKDKPLIEKHWKNILIEKPFMFNGNNYYVNNFKIVKEDLKISVNKLDFRTYVWARDTGIKEPGLGAFVTGVYLYDDTNFYFPRRGEHVTYNSGKLNGVLGGLDYSDCGAAFIWDHILATTLKEIKEEVEVDRKIKKEDLKFFIIGFNPESYRIDVRFTAKAKILGFKNKESREIVAIPKEKLADFIKNKPEEFTENDLNFIKQLPSSF